MTGIYGWLAGKAWWLVVVAALCAVILGQRAQVSNAKAATARVQSAWSAQKAADAQATIEINNENQRITGRWNATVIGALNAQKTRNARLEADAAGASAERDRLLDAARRAAAKRRLPSSPADAGPERADPLSLVLGACSAEVQELGRLADRHASDVQTLMDAWPRP